MISFKEENMCKLKKLSLKDLPKIIDVYNEIKLKTNTVWEDDYPSVELIKWDIDRKGLYALVTKQNEIVAIAYAGKRNEEDDSCCEWKLDIKNRATFARFGVNPKFQRQGYGRKMLVEIFDMLKRQGFDGVRILVEPLNLNAIGLYKKMNFKNSGIAHKNGKDYIMLEKFL